MRPETFRAMEMDTDSFYRALTENSLYECFTDMAKTEMEEKDNIYHRQENCYQPNAKEIFFTRSTCQKQYALDKRTPGFFKNDWNGTEMICRNNKACNNNEKRWLQREATRP